VNPEAPAAADDNTSPEQNKEHSRCLDKATLFPQWMVRPFGDFLTRQEEERRFFHISLNGLRSLSNAPKVVEFLIEIEKDKAEYDDADAQKRLELAREQTAWIQREEARGYPILNSHAAVALWTTLEVLVEDVLVAWLAIGLKSTPEMKLSRSRSSSASINSWMVSNVSDTFWKHWADPWGSGSARG
jgi:hypothetical protein